MEVESTTTIERIKAEIQAREDVLAENQRLLFGGRQLEEGNTLDSYEIQAGSTINLVTRLRGGVSSPCL